MKQKLVHCQYGTRSNKQLNTKQHQASNQSTDLEEDMALCQQKLEFLEQRQNNIAAHYLQKISQLRDILSKQAETKNELSKQLVNLNKEGQEQLDYLAKLKMLYSDKASLQNSISQKEINLIASDYMLEHRKVKEKPKRSTLKNGLLSLGKLSWSIQKCKSQSNLGLRLVKGKADYVPSSSKCVDKNDYLLIG